jgi:hypothetical protein
MLSAALTLAPLSWIAGTGTMIVLVRVACTSGNRGSVLAAGVVATLAALASAGLANAARPEGGIESPTLAFVRRLAVGMALAFALVNALSAVPALLLSPCPA